VDDLRFAPAAARDEASCGYAGHIFRADIESAHIGPHMGAVNFVQ